MIYGFLTRTEFARHAGISNATITKGVKSKRLVVDRRTQKLDPSNAVNLRYLQNVMEKNIGKGISKDLADFLERGFADSKPDLTEEERANRIAIESVATNSKDIGHLARKVPEIPGFSRKKPPPEKASEEQIQALAIAAGAAPGDKLKEAQTTLANLKIARELEDLILKTMVKGFFGRLSGVMTNRLLCLGQRMSKPLCDVFGDRDPEKQIKVQGIVDREMAGAIEAIQREISDATDW